MAYKLTGLTDIAIGSWEYHKASKALREGNISEETSLSRKRYNRTKAGIGALKLALIGYASTAVLTPTLSNNSFSNIDIGLLSAFAAGYAVLGFSTLYSNILSDEASNYKYNQSNLENDFKIISNDKKHYELNAGEAYQLYMFGNKLATGNPVDSFMFKIKNKINDWKLNFEIDKDNEFGIIKKSIHQILKKTGIENLMNEIYEKSLMKKTAYETLKTHTDLKSADNQEFVKYINTKHKDIASNPDDVKSKLKEINQEAILKTYQKLLVQNLQIFFSQVVNDYNKGIVHKDLIMKFEKLNQQNTINSNKEHLFGEYEKISKIARRMINNEDLSTKFKSNIDTLKYLGSDIVDKNNTIKFLNFENIFKMEKKAIVNLKNGISKKNDNIYQDKKACFNELSFDEAHINNMIIIKNAKDTIKLDNKNKISIK